MVAAVAHAATGVVGFVGLVLTIVGFAGIVVDLVRLRTTSRRDLRLRTALQSFRQLDRSQRAAVLLALRRGPVPRELEPLVREQAYRVVAQPVPFGAGAGTVLVAAGVILARWPSIAFVVLGVVMVLVASVAVVSSVGARERARRVLAKLEGR